MIYGYHRTSTTEQHLERGINEITIYCKEHKLKLEKIFTDQHTGKNFSRPRYTVLRDDILRSGDVLIITEVDRLGRNKQEILEQLRYYSKKDIRVMILEIPTTLMELSSLDKSMAKMILETVNNLLIEVYATMAQAEMEKKEKRQKEGIEAMKERGEWNKYGRPPAMDFEIFKREYELVKNGTMKPTELMEKLKMKKSTFYRYRKLLSLDGVEHDGRIKQ